MYKRTTNRWIDATRETPSMFGIALVFNVLLAGGVIPALASPVYLRVIVPARQTSQEKAIARMFVEETARRSANSTRPAIDHGFSALYSSSPYLVLIAERRQVASLLPVRLLPAWQNAIASLHPGDHAEAFSVVSILWRQSVVTIIAGNDVRGELFGTGWLLRNMNYGAKTPQPPSHLQFFQAPEKPVRGHQIGYRSKNNTYDAWTLAQFEQEIRNLAMFGTNTIQLISPSSDDEATSPLFPLPALDTLLGISRMLAKYGLDCDLYYPEMRKDYRSAAESEAELKDFEALVRAMPRLNALYIPGGDPGHTPPEVLLPLIAREAEVLHRYHPKATVWISAQGFTRDQYERFYSLLQEHPKWLTGVFFGPQSRDSFPIQRERIPAEYPMQFYPDVAHTMHAQFPVPQWDPIFALTEGREPICPRPDAFNVIYHRFQALHEGFITYSEGVNDDVNKMVWSQLGWSSTTPIDSILGEYARMFLHREGADQQLAVRALHGLEQDWEGPLQINQQISITRQMFETLETRSTLAQIHANGQWESLLYRAIYDNYLQHKLRRERSAEGAALATLSQPNLSGTDRVALVHQWLTASTPDAIERSEHDRLFDLGGKLFQDYGLQLSVPLYGAANWERGANLDRVDTPLTDAVWLNAAVENALKSPAEEDRQRLLDAVVHWQHPTADALYDDLGDPGSEPHLVRGMGWANDPEMYHTAVDGIADRTLADGWRLSWLDYAESLYETPLELQYRGLDPKRAYRLRVTYAGEDYALPLQLIANQVTQIHPPRLRHANPETVEFSIPASAVASGTLRLSWIGPEGSGGSGRGRQVAEVWLLPQ